MMEVNDIKPNAERSSAIQIGLGDGVVKLMPKIFTLLAALFVLSSCIGNYSWHQKMTVIVQTPEGEVSGSAITRVGWSKANSVGNYPASYSGEAVIVELPSAQYLFALLSENTKFVAFRTFKEQLNSTRMGADLFAEVQSLRSSGTVQKQHYPLLVTFDDINNPASVREVDPNDLDATFGEGYSLKSATLEITDEPVTEGEVEKVLGWLCRYKKNRARLNGSTSIGISTNALSDVLGTGSFKIGGCEK